MPIKDIRITKCFDSTYVVPMRMSYTQDGIQKSWDYIKSHNSVSIILYHAKFDSLLFVSQFRPALYINNPTLSGYTYELCAGLVDKDKSLEQIAIEEVEEECGYKIENISLVTSFFSNVGLSGAKQSMFYAEIDESQKISEGGGIDGEDIELVFVKLKDLKDFMYDTTKAKSPSVSLAILWFLDTKYNKLH